MKILSIVVCYWCLTSLAFAECQFNDRAVDQKIATYHACLENQHPMAVDLIAALDQPTKKQLRAAIKVFDETLKQGKGDTSIVYFRRGLANLALGKERRALRDFETVNTQMGDYGPGHFYRGITLQKQRKYRDSISALDTAAAISSNPGHLASIYYAKARAHRSTRSRELAIASLGDAIKSDETFAPAYFERARLREKEGERRLAIEDYSQYIQLIPDAAEAYYNRGLIYQDLRQDHLAIDDFSRAIELNPDYLKARASKGVTYIWPLLPVLLVLMAG